MYLPLPIRHCAKHRCVPMLGGVRQLYDSGPGTRPSRPSPAPRRGLSQPRFRSGAGSQKEEPCPESDSYWSY